MNPFIVPQKVRDQLNYFNDYYNTNASCVLVIYSSYDPHGVKLVDYINKSGLPDTKDFIFIDLFDVPNLQSVFGYSRSPSLFFYSKKGNLISLEIPSAIYSWIDNNANLQEAV